MKVLLILTLGHSSLEGWDTVMHKYWSDRMSKQFIFGKHSNDLRWRVMNDTQLGSTFEVDICTNAKSDCLSITFSKYGFLLCGP